MSCTTIETTIVGGDVEGFVTKWRRTTCGVLLRGGLSGGTTVASTPTGPNGGEVLDDATPYA